MVSWNPGSGVDAFTHYCCLIQDLMATIPTNTLKLSHTGSRQWCQRQADFVGSVRVAAGVGAGAQVQVVGSAGMAGTCHTAPASDGEVPGCFSLARGMGTRFQRWWKWSGLTLPPISSLAVGAGSMVVCSHAKLLFSCPFNSGTGSVLSSLSQSCCLSELLSTACWKQKWADNVRYRVRLRGQLWLNRQRKMSAQ